MRERRAPEGRFDTRNRLCYWHPVVLECKIPAPKTILVPFTDGQALRFLDGQSVDGWERIRDQMFRACDELGYPVFMRTDEASGKHGWRRTCFVAGRDSVMKNLSMLIEYNASADIMGLSYDHLVFREYIEPHHDFTAFDGMPVSLEFRFFARDGKCLCHHPYWFPRALKEARHSPPLPKDWEHRLKALYQGADGRRGQVQFLKGYAERITSHLKGCWSVDFMFARNGWWLTDMALGGASYHYPHGKEKRISE